MSMGKCQCRSVEDIWETEHANNSSWEFGWSAVEQSTAHEVAMSLPPVLYHYFRHPVPYSVGLTLQEAIHNLQLKQRPSRSHSDILLLLQHRPVYTAGRRQTESEICDERTRLKRMGADFVTANRGGELTYHGPGQITGYPLIDLSRYTPTMGARDYVCRMQKLLELHLREAHGLETMPSEHTGVFLNKTTKLASIGVQIRHRLTSHGFAINVTREPLAWFDKVVACGLVGVKAESLESVKGVPMRIEDEMSGLVVKFGQLYEREMIPLNTSETGDIGEVIKGVEETVAIAGSWPRAPTEWVSDS